MQAKENSTEPHGIFRDYPNVEIKKASKNRAETNNDWPESITSTCTQTRYNPTASTASYKLAI
jgi:hypothetical protein